jgi:group I intron endonuclease
VYAIVNLMNGRRYIGSTVNFQGRMQIHRNELRRGTHSNRHLQAAWKKYGEDAFVFGIVQEYTPHQVIEKEQMHLNAAQPHVYNIGKIVSPAALGLRRSEETKALHRTNALARVAAGTNGFDRLTPEQKQRRADAVPRVAEANRGQKRSEETKARIRAAWVTRKRRSHCKHGHEFTTQNTRFVYAPVYRRRCLACSKRANALFKINSRPHAA